MTVKEFIEKEMQSKGFGSIGYFRRIISLLDEFDSEACSVLAGKMRAQLGEPKERVSYFEVVCGIENPCCDRRGEYNGFASGPLSFICPKHCSCHD